MAVLFLDDFVRADADALGNGWTETGSKTANQRITGNKLTYNVSGAGQSVPGCNQTTNINNPYNREMVFDYEDTGSSSTTKHRIIFAFSNTSNWIGLQISMGSTEVDIVQSASGIVTVMDTIDIGAFLGNNRKFKLIQRKQKVFIYANNNDEGDLLYKGVFNLSLSNLVSYSYLGMGFAPKRSFNGQINAEFDLFSVRNISPRRRTEQ